MGKWALSTVGKDAVTACMQEVACELLVAFLFVEIPFGVIGLESWDFEEKIENSDFHRSLKAQKKGNANKKNSSLK